MKKSISDRLMALEEHFGNVSNESLEQAIKACLDVLKKAIPIREAAQLAEMVQRIKAGEPTAEEQAMLDAMPNAELEASGATALQVIEAVLHFEENY